MTDTKITLKESEIPTHFYNIVADLPSPPAPPVHPGTGQPIGPEALAPIFPQGLIAHEVSRDRAVEIPDEVRDIYRLYRPTPVYRARAFEELLDTPAKIYYKSEHVSPVGSHKLNTALVQAYFNKREGVKRLATETGAGQWGSALACASKLMGLECMVYMVRVSYDQKPYRRVMMKTYGAEVVASPSSLTNAGRTILAAHPDSPGSLGIAISEAVEDAAGRDDTKYALGSVLNHVLLHQTVIGLEARKQMELAGDYPDIVIACHGGGSNFAGLAFPFLGEKLRGERKGLRAIAVEPASCPTLTAGGRRYDFGDTAGMTPLLMMHTLGHEFHAAAGARRRPALPRLRPPRQPPPRRRPDRGRGLPAGDRLRERREVRPVRGDDPRPRIRPRRPQHHRPRPRSEEVRQAHRDPLQPLRPRPLRPRRLRLLPRRHHGPARLTVGLGWERPETALFRAGEDAPVRGRRQPRGEAVAGCARRRPFGRPSTLPSEAAASREARP